MADDDAFEPRLGRMRARGGKRGRKYLHRVLAAANLARGGAFGGRVGLTFAGSRIGRGSGVGRMLMSRDRFAAFRARRVIIKSRIVKLAGKGLAGATAHLRYIQRDGTTREGAPGQLYGAETEEADGKTFLGRAAPDRHQFRFIVSPEDGADYDDLKPLTRRLMTRVEADLGTKLDWVAVDHFNTGHPHIHIIVRGVDDRGRDLIIARDYLTDGMRERAAELIDIDLGPRDDRAIEGRLRAEIEQERLTGIDRRLLAAMNSDRIVEAAAPQPFEQSLRAGRLVKLARLGLAAQHGHGRWTLAEGLEDTLRRMGERGDIIRTMQRAFAARGNEPAPADQSIFDPAMTSAPALVGRVIERGLSDEARDRHYLLVEATDGRTHYVDIGRGDGLRQWRVLRYRCASAPRSDGHRGLRRNACAPSRGDAAPGRGGDAQSRRQLVDRA
jgi:type IV secretory pathway VirD2 relaxase